jgi:hypothetical protein
MKKLVLTACTLALIGCAGSSKFDKEYAPDRAEFGATPIPVPPPPPPPLAHVEIVNDEPTTNPGIAVEHVTGTWIFTAPPTVTRVEKKTEDMWQVSIYQGVPALTDTPFVVIQISKDPQTLSETDKDTYKVKKQRQYILNGNMAQEWTGNTTDGSGFCELLIRKPADAGDVCHAMAIAKTQEERQTALDILGSIVWKSSESPNP